MRLFEPFPKIPRLNRDCTITEKIDGTNAGIHIGNRATHEIDDHVTVVLGDMIIWVSSRTRWIKPQDDNYGFSSWVVKNADDLLKLGEGSHFGEWWGKGIQCGYGLTERKFSLFNTSLWGDVKARPECCDVVPVLYEGPFSTLKTHEALHQLKTQGSKAVPGWARPEGIIVFHHAGGQYFKATCEKDESLKGK